MNFFTNKKGTLLINVMASIGILAVITFISIPNLRQFQANIKLDDSSRALAINLRYAQQLAITNQVIHGVEIFESLNYYNVVKVDAATTTIKTISLPAEVTFTDVSGFSSEFISFNSYGSAKESGSIEITHTSNGDSKIINVRPSGYVQLQ